MQKPKPKREFMLDEHALMANDPKRLGERGYMVKTGSQPKFVKPTSYAYKRYNSAKNA